MNSEAVHPATLERPGQPQHIIPVSQDEALLNRPFEPGRQMAGLLLTRQALELLITQVAQARGKLHPQ